MLARGSRSDVRNAQIAENRICRSVRGRALSGAATVWAVREVLQVLRGYLSAGLLSLAAILLLAFGAPAKTALAGAGFALIGAAITRGIDIAREHRAEAARVDTQRRTEAAQELKDRRRDLDETRRLAYAAIVAAQSGARDPMLIATLVNALGYHGQAVDPAVATSQLLNPDQRETQRWLLEQIDRITAELGT